MSISELDFRAKMLRELAGYPVMQAPDGVSTRSTLDNLVCKLSEEVGTEVAEFMERNSDPNRTAFHNYTFRRRIYKLHVALEILGGNSSLCSIFVAVLNRFQTGINGEYEKFATEFREACGAVASQLGLTLPPAPKLE